MLEGSSTKLDTSVIDEDPRPSSGCGRDEWRDSAFGCVVNCSMRLESCESIEARDWAGGA
jgi:hypothetical protein